MSQTAPHTEVFSTSQQNMGSFLYPDLEEVLKIDFRTKMARIQKVKTTRPPYSREKINKYARRNRVGGCFECFVEHK